MKFSLTYLLLLVLVPLLSGQNETSVTKNFRFSDGVYLTFEQFQSNKPAYKWEELEVVFATNPQTYLTQIERVFLIAQNKFLSAKNIWAICTDGIPYVRVPENEINKELPTFAALKLRGKICYFTYPDWRYRKYEIAAYNPLNGRPFRKGTVEREEELMLQKMMHFESGEIVDFNVGNLLRWIQDDKPLVETVSALSEEDQEDKLFKCLLIYVDRNPVFLKNSSTRID